TFVAGKAIAVSHDRRLSWWTFLMQPREGDRVVVMSFAPALIVAYLSMLMDLPEQPLLAEPWLEEFQVMLRDGIAQAWPVNADPSFWDGPQAAEVVQQDRGIGEQRRRLAIALNNAIEEVEQERTMRVRRAALLPERLTLFSDTTRQGWVRHRTLGPTLRALGAPAGALREEEVVLLTTALPKAAFVGEASE